MDEFGTWLAISVIVEALVRQGLLNRETVLALLAAAEANVDELESERPIGEIAGLIRDVGRHPDHYFGEPLHC